MLVKKFLVLSYSKSRHLSPLVQYQKVKLVDLLKAEKGIEVRIRKLA